MSKSHFWPKFPFYTPWKPLVFWCFQGGYGFGTLARNSLINIKPIKMVILEFQVKKPKQGLNLYILTIFHSKNFEKKKNPRFLHTSRQPCISKWPSQKWINDLLHIFTTTMPSWNKVSLNWYSIISPAHSNKIWSTNFACHIKRI